MAKKPKNQKEEPEVIQQEEIDKLVSKGKKQGYLTISQITKGLPDEMMTPDQIDETLMWFDDHDIEVVEKKKTMMRKTRFPKPMKSIPFPPTGR